MSPQQRIVIRASDPGDTVELVRLAALDSATAIDGPSLVGEIDGSIVAAVSLDGGRPIANPFVESAHVVEMLESHLRALRAAAVVRHSERGRGRLIPVPA